MKRFQKIKVWHLMPLSLLALIGVAVLIWFTQGDFSTKDVVISIDGPQQVENGVAETFHIIVENKSSKTLRDTRLSLEVPATLQLKENKEELAKKFGDIASKERKEVAITIAASSSHPSELFHIRFDYSPEGLAARFVSTSQREIVIGKLDASFILDLPSTIYADQEIRGTIFITPNADIAADPLYLKLSSPEGFKLQDVSSPFDFETVWKLEKLVKGQTIKREFRGRISSFVSNPTFRVAVGRIDGISFLSLAEAERTIAISQSPLFVEEVLLNKQDAVASPGERLRVRLTYTNKAKVPLEDAVVTVTLPRDLVDFSSITASGGNVDPTEGTITWDKSRLSQLRFTDLEGSGSINFSFSVADTIQPLNVHDSNKVLYSTARIRSEKEQLSLDGAVLQGEHTLPIKLTTVMHLEQDVFHQGGSFENVGPTPPQANELTTYTVRWRLSNTSNQVRSPRIEAVLPSYAVWRDMTKVGEGELKFVSATNTVVWSPSTLSVGLGSIYPDAVAEFQIGVMPSESDVVQGVEAIHHTKVTGVDTFTSTFLEQDIGGVRAN